jgi:hypothetical protein
MSHDETPPDTLEGRRLVMYGGNPYEDDLEPADTEPARRDPPGVTPGRTAPPPGPPG